MWVYCTLVLTLVLLFFYCLLKLIAECEQVKTERESELIIEQVLIAMSAMGLDRERTLQVRAYTVSACMTISEFSVGMDIIKILTVRWCIDTSVDALGHIISNVS